MIESPGRSSSCSLCPARITAGDGYLHDIALAVGVGQHGEKIRFLDKVVQRRGDGHGGPDGLDAVLRKLHHPVVVVDFRCDVLDLESVPEAVQPQGPIRVLFT